MHIKNTRILFTAILLLWTLQTASAQKAEVVSGQAVFNGSTPVERFSGLTESISGTLDFSTGEFSFTVDLRPLDTGNSRRDRNMHEDYLQTETYPYASYKGNIESIPDPDLIDEQEVVSEGTFTLKETEREKTVTGALRYDEDEQAWVITAVFEVLLTDFDISRPRFLFIRMRDEVELEVRLLLEEAPQE